MHLVSVIIPVYNVEQYFNKCITSIVQQTYTNIEIILINDGSTDNSLELCNNWKAKDARIVVYNQNNSGPSIARNKGIQVSTGEWFFFVDSDDYIAPNAIERLVREIRSDIGVVEGNTRFLSKQNFDNYDTTFFKKSRMVKSKDLFFDFYYRKILISPWNKLIRRDIVDNSMFIPNRFGEDVKFVLDISIYMEKKHLDYIQIPDVIYYYTINPCGTMQSRTARLRVDSRILVYEEATKYYEMFGHARSRRIYLDMWQEILSINDEFDDINSCLCGHEDLRKEWMSFVKSLDIENFYKAKGLLGIWLKEKLLIYKVCSVWSKMVARCNCFAKRLYLCYCRRILKLDI